MIRHYTTNTGFSQHYRYILYNLYFNHMLEISCVSCVLNTFQHLHIGVKTLCHGGKTRLTTDRVSENHFLSPLIKILISDNFMMTDNWQIRAHNGIVI